MWQQICVDNEQPRITQIWPGILPIHIDTGCYRGLQLYEQICYKCTGITWNEFYFSFDSPTYDSSQSESLNFSSLYDLSRIVSNLRQ